MVCMWDVRNRALNEDIFSKKDCKKTETRPHGRSTKDGESDFQLSSREHLSANGHENGSSKNDVRFLNDASNDGF